MTFGILRDMRPAEGGASVRAAPFPAAFWGAGLGFGVLAPGKASLAEEVGDS